MPCAARARQKSATISVVYNNFLLFILLIRICPTTAGEKPTIAEHPLDILVVKGDPATLRCGANGENVEVSWYKDGEPVKVGSAHRLILPNGSLLLLKVNNGGTDSEAGTYYCVARNEYGEARSQEANVRIASLRDEFRANPHAVQALIGSSAMLECTPPKGFPEPVVTWRKDEKDVNFAEETRYKLHPSGNFIIENVERSDAGFYQCIAANMVGERTSKPARLSVYEKPRFLAEPKDVTTEANASVVLNCRVSGEPMPSISWKKRNDQMPIGRAYVTKDSHGLRIDRVQAEDAGEYICVAKNPVGSIETSAKLHVNAPPHFTKYPENVRVSIGETATFACEAAGRPQPGIFWSKEGDQDFTFFTGLVSTDGRIQVASDGRLLVDNVRASDQGNYVCAAVNSAGSTLAKASLHVINANPSHPPPVIMYGHQNQTLMVSDMAILPCQATGRVPASISWYKDGELLQLASATDNLESDAPNVRFRQLVTGTLQILELNKDDTGVYTCKAKNEDGEATWTASLLVEKHTNPNTLFQRMPEAGAFPSAPGKPRLINATDDAIELEWTAPEKHGATPIIGYILQYWSPALKESWINVLDVVPSARFRVKRLRPGQAYAFVVRAENSKGIGPPSDISDIISTKFSTPDVEKDRVNDLLDLEAARKRLAAEQLVKLVEVRPLNATAMLLSFRHQRHEPLVQGYYIKWRGPPLASSSGGGGSATSGTQPEHSWVNVSDASAESAVVSGLRPATHYEFFVIPYHQSVQGMPSNSLDGTTMETVPSMPPMDVRLRMLNVTSLRVSWRQPPPNAMNGALKGFLINIKSNQSEERNITTNERATSVTLYRLIADASYAIRVAARTSAGYGPFFVGEPVVMNEETLQNHMRQASDMRHGDSWYKQPLSVLTVGIVLWCVLLMMIVFVWYRCCHRRARRKGARDDDGDSGPTKDAREFIKIRDGSVVALGGGGQTTTTMGGAAGGNTAAMAQNSAFWAGDYNHHTGSSMGLSGQMADACHSSSGFAGNCAGSANGLGACGHYYHQHHHHHNHSHHSAQRVYDGEMNECVACGAPAYATDSDYGGAMSGGTLPTLNHNGIPFYGMSTCGGGICNPAGCSTLQKSARSHSPSHHYHYAQLPDVVPGAGNDVLSTFYNQGANRQYYDDPSPYATTTLVMNGSSAQAHTPRIAHRGGTLSHGHHHHHNHHHPLQGQHHPSSHGNLAAVIGASSGTGPLLPLNPIPKDPPRNFLSNAAMGATNSMETNEQSQPQCGSDRCCDARRGCCTQQQHAGSCEALLEMSSQMRMTKQTSCPNCESLHQNNNNNNKQQLCTIADNQIPQCCISLKTKNYAPQQHCVVGGIAENHHHAHSGARTSQRAALQQNDNNISTQNSEASTRCFNDYSQAHRNSPYTDVSYIQSSDGTNGSGKTAILEKISPPGNILDLVPPPPPPPSSSINESFWAQQQQQLGEQADSHAGAFYDAVAELSQKNFQKFQSNHHHQKALSAEFNAGASRTSLNNISRNHRKGEKYSSGSMSRARSRSNKSHQPKSRLSLIERDNDDNNEGENIFNETTGGLLRHSFRHDAVDEKSERDPLLADNNAINSNYAEDAEADGELSEDERLPSCSSLMAGGNASSSSRPPCDGAKKRVTALENGRQSGGPSDDNSVVGDASSDFVIVDAAGFNEMNGQEISDGYFNNNNKINNFEKFAKNNNNSNNNNNWSKGFSPKQQQIKARRPMMGVNASTLSQGEDAINRMSASKLHS